MGPVAYDQSTAWISSIHSTQENTELQTCNDSISTKTEKLCPTHSTHSVANDTHSLLEFPPGVRWLREAKAMRV